MFVMLGLSLSKPQVAEWCACASLVTRFDLPMFDFDRRLRPKMLIITVTRPLAWSIASTSPSKF